MFEKLQLQVYTSSPKKVLFNCLGEFNKLYSLINFFDKDCALELKGNKDNVSYHLSSGNGNNKYYAVLLNELDESTAIDIEKALSVAETAKHVLENIEQYKENLVKVKEQLGFNTVEKDTPKIEEIKEESMKKKSKKKDETKPKRKYNKKQN